MKNKYCVGCSEVDADTRKDNPGKDSIQFTWKWRKYFWYVSFTKCIAQISFKKLGNAQNHVYDVHKLQVTSHFLIQVLCTFVCYQSFSFLFLFSVPETFL